MSADGVIRVVIVDDHQLVRQGLEAVVASVDDIAVVGQAADGRSAVEIVAATEPDVVLMDLQLPERSGLEATREILEARAELAVLVLTMFDDDATVHAAIAAGAVGYLLKGADGEDILAAVRSAAAGQAVFGAALAHRMRTFFAGGTARSASVVGCTGTGAAGLRSARASLRMLPGSALSMPPLGVVRAPAGFWKTPSA